MTRGNYDIRQTPRHSMCIVRHRIFPVKSCLRSKTYDKLLSFLYFPLQLAFFPLSLAVRQLWRNCGFLASWDAAESWLAICTNNYRNYLSLRCELNWNLNCIRLLRRDSVLSHNFPRTLGKTFSHTHTHTQSVKRSNFSVYFSALFIELKSLTSHANNNNDAR